MRDIETHFTTESLLFVDGFTKPLPAIQGL